MEIIKKECKTFIERAYCDCGEELFSHTVNCTMPPSYNYECSKCGAKFTLDKNYPKNVYKELE